MAKKKNASAIAKWYRWAGLLLIAAVYMWGYLTAQDQFWAGKSTVFAMIVLFVVAVFDLVMKNGVEKS